METRPAKRPREEEDEHDQRGGEQALAQRPHLAVYEPAEAAPKRVRTVKHFDPFYGSTLGSGSGAMYAPDGGPREPRLRVLPLAMLFEKEVLHVGCGAGYNTIAIAELFQPCRILGIDSDPEAIRKARAQLRARAMAALLAERQSQRAKGSESGPAIRADGAASVLESGPTKLADAAASVLENAPRSSKLQWMSAVPAGAVADAMGPTARFPRNVSFRVEDARDAVGTHGKQSFDCILCFGVVRRAHIQGGDAALESLFSVFSRLLRPGGVLVMDHKSWKTYKGRLPRGTPCHLNIRPAAFPTLLVTRHGFHNVTTTAAPPLPSEAVGTRAPADFDPASTEKPPQVTTIPSAYQQYRERGFGRPESPASETGDDVADRTPHRSTVERLPGGKTRHLLFAFKPDIPDSSQ
jgi:SAM-dependent methyltransferase